MLLHSSKHKTHSTAVALAMLGLVCTPYSARADVMEQLGQSLAQQGGQTGLVVPANPSPTASTGSSPQPVTAQSGSVVPANPTPVSTQPTAESGGIFEQAQSSTVVQQAEAQVGGAIEQKADGIADGILGKVGGTVGNIFGHHSGILGSLLDPFERQMDQYMSAATDFLHNAIGDFLGHIFGHADGTASEGEAPGEAAATGGIGADTPPGAMGIPDPYAVHKSIEQNAMGGANGDPSTEAQQADRFNVNPVVLTHSLSAEQDLTLDKTIAASVLSDEGQQAMSDERTAAAQTLEQIQAKAEEAQGMDVTQDVMKNLTAMVSGQSALESGSYAQTMMIHQQLSATGIVESNISEALDETNRARHVEAMAGATGLLRSASAVYLPGS